MSATMMTPPMISILASVIVSLLALASSALIAFVRSNASQEAALRLLPIPEEGVIALTTKGGDYHGS